MSSPSGPVRHLRSGAGNGAVLEATPATVGWRFVSFRVVRLEAGASLDVSSEDQEQLVVPLTGAALLQVHGADHEVRRDSVFTQAADVLYLPPRVPCIVRAETAFEVAIGGAPAEGRYAARLYRAAELATFVRGGANVRRGVTVTLDPTFASERLIAYEIVTPSGNWSSFPPHRHDGREGTTYHEETYYYRLDPADGFAVQRLYTRDTDLDVAIPVGDGDLVMVHEGYLAVATAPGTNAYYLNILACESKPVVQRNDPAYDWVAGDWEGRPAAVPVGD